jgi:hypothetical protein
MHTKNLRANGASIHTDDECIGVAYGWDREFKYDAEGKLANSPKSTDEALANAKLWAAAADLVEALKAARAALAQCNHIPGVTEQTILTIDEALSNAGVI